MGHFKKMVSRPLEKKNKKRGNAKRRRASAGMMRTLTQPTNFNIYKIILIKKLIIKLIYPTTGWRTGRIFDEELLLHQLGIEARPVANPCNCFSKKPKKLMIRNLQQISTKKPEG